ncbi:MAG: phosphatase PAP2 family protein [Ferruginibacter sp.]|nr:phosphatase PAP2 family protein [Chitinophagaceae bacterium]
MSRSINYSIMLPVSLFLISTGLFAALAHEVVVGRKDWFDTHMFIFLKEHLQPGFIKLFKLFTFFGSPVFLHSSFAIVVLYLLSAKRRKDALAVIITWIISFVLLNGMKLIFKRSRPDLPLFEALNDYSFPSGHAFHSFIFYSVVGVLVWETGWSKKWKIMLSIALFLLVLAIGMSRIVLRYHYASDVLAGFCMGCACLSVYLMYRKKRNRRGKVTSFKLSSEL